MDSYDATTPGAQSDSTLINGFQILQCFSIGDFITFVHVVDDQLSVEVIGFVLPDAGEQIVSGSLNRLPVYVLSTDDTPYRPPNANADFGKAETAFVRFNGIFKSGQYRIHKNHVVTGFPRRIAHKNPLEKRHLRPGKTHSFVLFHQLQHLFRQPDQKPIEDRYRRANLAQPRVGITNDLQLFGIDGGQFQHPLTDCCNLLDFSTRDEGVQCLSADFCLGLKATEILLI